MSPSDFVGRFLSLAAVICAPIFLIQNTFAQSAPESAIIEELSQLSQQHQISIRLDPRATEELSTFDSSWDASTKGPLWKLQPDGVLSPRASADRGWAFGHVEQFEAETDVNLKIRKLLWNAESVFDSQHFFKAAFNFDWQPKAMTSRHTSGTLIRAYRDPSNTAAADVQLEREFFKITAPDWLNGFAFLTFRSRDAAEDYVWMASRAVNKTRQLSGSLRSDGLFNSAMSLDDFFTYSGKIDSVRGSEWNEQTLWVPLTPEIAQGQTDNDGCLSFKRTPQASFDSGAFTFSKRSVIQIELLQKDPFSKYGRQTIYFDKELQIPLIKIVFDQTGRSAKLVVTQMQLGRSADGKIGLALPWRTKAFDLVDDSSAELNLQSFTACPSWKQRNEAADLDPNKLFTAPTPLPQRTAQHVTAKKQSSSSSSQGHDTQD